MSVKKSKLIKEQVKPKNKYKDTAMTHPEALKFVAGIGTAKLNYLTDEQIKKLEEIAAYLTLQQVADYFGITIHGLKNIFERQPNARYAYKVGRSKKIAKFASLLEEKGSGINKDCDATSLIFFLKTRGGWSESAPVETVDTETAETSEEKAAKEQEYKEFLEFRKIKSAGKLKEFMAWAKLKFIGN